MMSTGKKNKGIEIQLEELLTKMEEHLTPELKRLIDLSYKLSKKEPDNIKVNTSNSTSASNHLNA